MEKRKLLLVAVSVGVFLVIVLSAAILIFTPTGGSPVAALRPLTPVPSPVPVSSSAAPPASARGPASADVADIARNPGEIQGLITPPSVVPALSVVSEAPAPAERGADATGVVISVPKPTAPALPVPEDRNSGAGLAAATPSRSTPAATTTARSTPPTAATTPAASTSTSPATPAPTARSTTSASATTTPASTTPATTARSTPITAATTTTATRPTSTSPATAAPVTVTPPVTTATPAGSGAASSTRTSSTSATGNSSASTTAGSAAARAIRDYWIQTGAFSALIRAEDAKESLASKGLNSIIDNREVDGQIWYRVRIGPYTSENEAGYWLPLVQAIDGFGDSQIRSTQR